jgi:hypothetical protein
MKRAEMARALELGGSVRQAAQLLGVKADWLRVHALKDPALVGLFRRCAERGNGRKSSFVRARRQA